MATLDYWRKDSSTFKRLRRSEHVADLLLIAYVAIVLLATAIILFVAWIFFPITPQESASCQGSGCFWRDFRGIGDIKFSFPIMGVASGVVAWVYRTAAVRLGVVDLFASEIMTLCRVGTAMDVGIINVKRWEMGHAARPEQAWMAADTHHLSFNSEEQYFPIFSQNSKDLEVLEAEVVSKVTSFYTYMKVLRDLYRQANATHSGSKDELEKILFNTVYMLFLGYEAARYSIKHLVEYDPTNVENTIIILLTEIVVFKCVLSYFENIDTDHDFRYERLKMRLPGYNVQICALKKHIDEYYFEYFQKKRNEQRDNDWKQAGLLWSELAQRFGDAGISVPRLEENTLKAIGLSTN